MISPFVIFTPVLFIDPLMDLYFCYKSLNKSSPVIAISKAGAVVTKIFFRKLEGTNYVITHHYESKADDDYVKEEQTLGHRIKEDMQDLLDKENIRKELIMYVDKDIDCGLATGSNFSNQGFGLIAANAKIYDVDPDACYAIIKHEIGHLKNNDPFYIDLVRVISGLTVALFYTMGFILFASTMPLVVSVTWTVVNGAIFVTAPLVISKTARFVGIVYTRYREGKADDFAITNSSDDELKGYRRFFKAYQQYCLNQCVQSIWEKISYSFTGNYGFDFTHPSTSSRLKKIEDELNQRGVLFSDEEDEEEVISGEEPDLEVEDISGSESEPASELGSELESGSDCGLDDLVEQVL